MRFSYKVLPVIWLSYYQFNKMDVNDLDLKAKLFDKHVQLTWTNLQNVKRYVYKRCKWKRYITTGSTATNNFIDKEFKKELLMYCMHRNNGVYSAFSHEAKVIN